jgi:3-isopropylmalate/(R)-2-methylmalate dehydratase large subunit
MSNYLYQNLAQSAGVSEVVPGQDVEIEVDLALGHDGTGPKLLKLWNPEDQVFDGRRVVFTVDHAFPAPTPEDRVFQREFAEFSKAKGCVLFNQGEGVLHQVVAERLSLWPGMIIAGADGHVATAGAFGAIAFALTPETLVPVLKTGKLKISVPEVVVIDIEGELQSGVSGRDLAFHLVWKYADQIKGKAVLLRGSFFTQSSDATRMALCNVLPEVGALTAVVIPAAEKSGDAYLINASEVVPMVAVPPAPTAIKPIKEVAGTVISVAIAGGCSAGRIEDMEAIVEVLKGQSIHPDVTFIVTPASRQVAKEMDNKGVSTMLRDRGVVIMPPGCGTCPGKHFGVLAPDDVAITTTIRNSPGRLGAKEAQVYLASPRSVAQAAVKGYIE